MLTKLSARPRRAPLILTALALLVVAGFGLAQLRIQDIVCKNAGGQECPAEVTSQLHSLKGSSLVFSDITAQAETTLAAERTYRIRDITKQFPSTLVVELEPQQLLYQIKLLGQSEFLTVSDTGRLIRLGQTEGLMVLFVPPEIWSQWQALGEVDPQLQPTLSQLPALLTQAKIQREAVVLHDSQTLVLYLPNNRTAIIDILELPGDLARLSTIQTQLQEQPLEIPVEEIDIRYDLPVLRPVRNIPRHQAL